MALKYYLSLLFSFLEFSIICYGISKCFQMRLKQRSSNINLLVMEDVENVLKEQALLVMINSLHLGLL